MNSDLDIVLSLLEEGKSVELPAVGYSMFPTFMPGQKFIVSPLPNGEFPDIGSVVVCLGRDGRHMMQIEGEKGRRGEREKRRPAQEKTQSTEVRARGGVLVMHRLVEIRKKDTGETLFITKGDIRQEADTPWKKEDVIGVVIRRKTKFGSRKIKAFMPGPRRIFVNKNIFKIYLKVRWFLE